MIPCRSQSSRPRQAARGSVLGLAGVLACAALAGCSFDQAEAADAPNTCSLPADCPSDLSCQAGVCVMRSVDAPLDVTLEVMPQRMPDGSQPFPILYGPFALQGGRRNFELPTPITIRGSVHDGAEVIDAQLAFVPTEAPPSLGKAIQARSGSIAAREEFSVQLLAGVEYRMSVQPTDSLVPPYSRVFVAEPGLVLDVDYANLATSTQSFVIRGAPAERLTVKARAKDGNQIVSNTVRVSDMAHLEGRVALTFASDPPPPYRVEVAADPGAISQLLSPSGDCDEDDRLVPTFQIDDSAFKREPSTRAPAAVDLAIDLPSVPEPVRYEGEIQLCTSRQGLDGLPISLRSTALALNNLPQGVKASFQVSSEAKREDNRTQSFCARVVPGEYVVVVTPPASLNCEIFAEKRQVLQSSVEPAALALHMPAKLNGTILDSNMLPVANATIDAIALGIDTQLMLAEHDLTVPIYNRSRQTSSDAAGTFALYVDVGVYDLIVKPPSQSGFAWQIQPSVSVGSARREDFTTRVELGPPALIEGTLRYSTGADQNTLAGAEVRAYTVEDAGGPNARGVEIGRTQADDRGNITLLISPEPQEAW